jgi:7-cyano-7-deazaguanine synthase
VVLLSGGLDSATTLAVARAEGYFCHALTVNYGQRHDREIEAAMNVASSLGVLSHRVIEVPLDALVSSALTDEREDLREADPDGPVPADIPDTYVPARNLIFLGLALSWAESMEARAVFIGANAVDYSGYPDCRPQFIEAFQRAADEGTRRGVQGPGIVIRAPLIDMPKRAIIEKARELDVPLDLTWSCYSGELSPCGKCDSCRLRADGFRDARIADPLLEERAGSTEKADVESGQETDDEGGVV